MLGAVRLLPAFLDSLWATGLHDGNQTLYPLEDPPLHLPLTLCLADAGKHAPVPAVSVIPATSVATARIPHTSGEFAVGLLHPELAFVAEASPVQPVTTVLVVLAARVHVGSSCSAAAPRHHVISSQLTLEEPGNA